MFSRVQPEFIERLDRNSSVVPFIGKKEAKTKSLRTLESCSCLSLFLSFSTSLFSSFRNRTYFLGKPEKENLKHRWQNVSPFSTQNKLGLELNSLAPLFRLSRDNLSYEVNEKEVKKKTWIFPERKAKHIHFQSTWKNPLLFFVLLFFSFSSQTKFSGIKGSRVVVVVVAVVGAAGKDGFNLSLKCQLILRQLKTRQCGWKPYISNATTATYVYFYS